MRLFLLLVSLAGVGVGGWYTWENVPAVRTYVQAKIHPCEFHTLEIRYTAEEIMRANKGVLLKNSNYSYLEPKLLYYPYLLMDVKYSQDRANTSEGILLWGLTDGEMVVDTATWDKTHGFEDCLLAKADQNDFKILKTLIENGGLIDREKLYNQFKVDHEVVDHWLDSCRIKKLIVASGNKFRLHFANPYLEIQPITYLDQALVSQPSKSSTKVKTRYTPTQIKKLAQVAFGGDFAIRKAQEIFLPVYCITVQNPDDSTRVVYYNALNGKIMQTLRPESL